MNPLVSILIPVYNCEAWVAQAVQSALVQTWSNKEIIAVDDASTDGSWDVLQTFASVIHIERVPINGGQNVTRNRLTELSHGEWLVYLDADDELAPSSVEEKMKFSSDAEAVYGSCEFARFCGQRKIEAMMSVAVDHADQFVAAFHWKFPNTSAFLFRKRALVEIGGWNEQIQNCTDRELVFKLLIAGYRLKAAPNAWSLYRQWSPNQAVYQSAVRMTRTRLNVMRDAASLMHKNGLMTPMREQAFLDACLCVVRNIYRSDRETAVLEEKNLRQMSPSFRPSRALFSQSYRCAYNTCGFIAAERLASFGRVFKTAGNELSNEGSRD